jgi:hypothetical protein
MRKAGAIVLAGLGAAALAGAATAASRNTHILNVPLPDGSTARVEYVGDVPPKVTVTPGRIAPTLAPFGMFDVGMFDIQRQMDAMMRQVNEMTARAIAAPGMNVAAYGAAPAGGTSVTVVTTSDGSKICTRRTEVTSQAAGKPPKVVTSQSGDCGPAAPSPSTPLNRT